MQKREERPSTGPVRGEEADQFLDQASALLIIHLAVITRLDSIAQILFSAGLIADVLPRLCERDPREGLARQVELTVLTQRALAEVRNLLLDLTPLPPVESDCTGASPEDASQKEL